MTERSHKPERKDADAVREKYDYEPERESEDDGTGTETYTSFSDGDESPTFFTDSGETPDVIGESLEGKDPSKLEALAERTHRRAEEVEEVEVSVGRREYLAQEVSGEALEESEREGDGPGGEEMETLEERRSELEERIEELEGAVEENEDLLRARRLKERGEAARTSPVLSLSDYRFETTRYFNVLEERFSKVSFEVGVDGETVEMTSGGWRVSRDDESGVLTAKAKAGGWINKKRVKLQAQVHPSPDDFKDGTAVIQHDTDMEESVTRFLREDTPDDYHVLVMAVPVSVSELPDEAVERVESFVDAQKSLVVVDMENSEVVYNETDEVARELSKKEFLNPETDEAEVSRISNTLQEEMISGDEMPASDAAERHDVSEKVATKAFSDVAESHSEFSVLTEKVSEPILVRW